MIQRRASSLRDTLLVPLLWLWLVPAVVATLSAFWLAGLAAQKAFDRVLKDDALALAAEIRWNGDEPEFQMDPSRAASLVFDSMAPTRFTVRTAAGRVLVGNAQLALPARAEHGAPNSALFYDSPTDWGQLRVVALKVQQPGSPTVWVIVGEAQAKRDEISRELASAIFLPAAGVGFVLVPLLFLGIGRGLAPARDLVTAVTARGIDDLSALSLEGVPAELRGLIERLNDLFRRLSEAIAHERRFIADAAHQLRTPTAGIKLLAEDLMQTQQNHPQSPPDPEVLAELHAAAARTSDLVRQLLALARAERDPALIERSEIDVVELVAGVIRRAQTDAGTHGKSVQVAQRKIDGGETLLMSNRTLLEEAVRNLVDNALIYGGGRLDVTVRCLRDQICIDVLDDGAALDVDTQRHLFTPFWRAQESRGPGSGLGLAIAQRTVRSLGGDVVFWNHQDPPGNCFSIMLWREPQFLAGQHPA